MKTLQDLVDTLNKNFDNEFDLFDKENGFEFCLRVDGAPIIDFNSRDKSFEFRSFIEYVYGRSLSVIVNFLANSNPEDWFAEKKYNIVLNNLEGEKIVINKYDRHSTLAIECSTGIDDDELKLDAYIFTEKEIEQLKLILPTNMAKIVDLGKVEVKDD